MSQNPYGYYYGNEADQYTFYRLPKALFTNDRYKNLSDGAKILYGLMLDRMGLSTKNGWLDTQDRVYIIFTLENVQEYMNCKHDKGVKLLAELDTEKGIGLIERVRQGQGKPAIIYVRKFFDSAEALTSEKPNSKLHDPPQSRLRENRTQDCGETALSKNNKNHTELSDNKFSQSACQVSVQEVFGAADERTDKQNLESIYEQCQLWIWEDEEIGRMFKPVIERLYYSDSVKVGNAVLPRDKIRSYLCLLDAEVITETYDKLVLNSKGVRNVTGYLMSALINGVCEKESGLLCNLPPGYLAADDEEGADTAQKGVDTG